MILARVTIRRSGLEKSVNLRRLSRFFAFYFLIAVLAAVALLIPLCPWHPWSVRSWIMYIALALPVMVVGEWVGDRLLSNPLSDVVERRTRGRRFSWVRVAYVVSLTLVVVGGLVLLAASLRGH